VCDYVSYLHYLTMMSCVPIVFDDVPLHEERKNEYSVSSF